MKNAIIGAVAALLAAGAAAADTVYYDYQGWTIRDSAFGPIAIDTR